MWDFDLRKNIIEALLGKLFDMTVSILKKSPSMMSILKLLVVPVILTITCYDQIISISVAINDSKIISLLFYFSILWFAVKFDSEDILMGTFLLMINTSIISQISIIPKEIANPITILSAGLMVRSILVTTSIYSHGKPYNISGWILKIVSMGITLVFLVCAVELVHYLIIAKSYVFTDIILNQRYFVMSVALSAYYIIENDRINEDMLNPSKPR